MLFLRSGNGGIGGRLPRRAPYLVAPRSTECPYAGHRQAPTRESRACRSRFQSAPVAIPPPKSGGSKPYMRLGIRRILIPGGSAVAARTETTSLGTAIFSRGDKSPGPNQDANALMELCDGTRRGFLTVNCRFDSRERRRLMELLALNPQQQLSPLDCHWSRGPSVAPLRSSNHLFFGNSGTAAPSLPRSPPQPIDSETSTNGKSQDTWHTHDHCHIL